MAAIVGPPYCPVRVHDVTIHPGREVTEMELAIEVLEERIAPDSINGVPGESNGNPGNEVSNGAKPQPGNNTADSNGN
jgi:hypothetical protein